MFAGQKNRVGSFLLHLLNLKNCRVIAASVKLAQNVQICILPLLDYRKLGIVYKSIFLFFTVNRDKWSFTSHYQSVASTRDTIDIILSIYNRICMVNPMSKLSNPETIYVASLEFPHFVLLLKRCLAKFDADDPLCRDSIHTMQILLYIERIISIVSRVLPTN